MPIGPRSASNKRPESTAVTIEAALIITSDLSPTSYFSSKFSILASSIQRVICALKLKTPPTSHRIDLLRQMPEIRNYVLSPTRLIPNSPYPLIHYPRYFANEKSCDAASIHELFASNGWQSQWIYRYGPTQPSHYHSVAHECMAVLSGSATIRFGVADTQADPESNTHGDGKEVGGIELQANAGDVFLIPAGVSHKTFDPQPASTFALLTPGGGHGIAGTDAREVLAGVDLSGFTMLGAYPQNSEWDFSEGGDHVGEFEKVWSVPKPRLDPVMGLGNEGICGLWH